MPIGLFRNVFLGSAGKYYTDVMAAPSGDCDPYWANVSMLVNLEDTTWEDVTGNTTTSLIDAAPTVTTAASKFGAEGLRLVGVDGVSSNQVKYASATDFQFGTGDFTIEGWFNTTRVTGWQTLFSDYGLGGVTTPFQVIFNDPFGVSWHTDASGHHEVPIPFTPGTWFHFAVTRSSGTMRMFVDGALIHSFADNLNYLTPAMLIGGRSTTTYGFDGDVDDFRITKGIARYTAAFTPPTEAFPTCGDLATDPYWTDVAYLIDAETGIVDLSDNASTIATTSAAVSTTQVKYGTQSVKLSGIEGSRLVLPTNPDLNFGTGDFTIEFDVWCTNVTDDGYFMDARDLATSSLPAFYVYYGSGGTVTFNGGNFTGLTANAWHHIAITRVAGVKKFYLDGIEKTSTEDVTDWNGNALTWNNRFNTFNYGIHDTYYDNIRITKGIARYTANFTPPTEAFPTG